MSGQQPERRKEGDALNPTGYGISVGGGMVAGVLLFGLRGALAGGFVGFAALWAYQALFVANTDNDNQNESHRSPDQDPDVDSSGPMVPGLGGSRSE